jgi:TonB family protein
VIAGDSEVVLTLTVDEQGKAQNIQLVKSTNPVIGERVVDAVQKFRWRPATLDKQPVPLDLTLNVEVQR